MARFLIGVLAASILAGCEKENTTNYVATIKNNTTHSIEIRPYFGGVSPIEKRINLGSGEAVEVGRGTDRGKGSQGFSFNFGAPDSMVVVFDGVFKISHYVNTPINLASRYYLYTSIRNLMNYKSYDYKIIDDSKHEMNVSYTYSFVEQDFLDTQ
jgi:hypothetical protein